MTRQRLDVWRAEIHEEFRRLAREHPERLSAPLNIGWSNWCFGQEDLRVSCDRLVAHSIAFIELHGNHYGSHLGYDADTVNSVVRERGLTVSGICGMFGRENDFSSAIPQYRESAAAYLRRELAFARAVGATYMILVPAAVGRPTAYDAYERVRAVTALRRCEPEFHGIRGAIEPIRADEVSMVHTVEDAERLIREIGGPSIRYINGDVYHVQSSEQYIPHAIRRCGERLINLHLADSNRRALGLGSMDIDTIIMTLYLMGYNGPSNRYVTFEPLGPGATPYDSRNSVFDSADLDRLVDLSVGYFREREKELVGS